MNLKIFVNAFYSKKERRHGESVFEDTPYRQMMENLFKKRQNEEKSIAMLAAQRQLYSDEKNSRITDF